MFGGLKFGIGCNNDPYTFPIEVKTTESKAKIKEFKKEAFKEENFSPTRKKLLETGKMQDIRSFLREKISKNKLEVRGGINQNSPPNANIERLAKPNSASTQPNEVSEH